MKSLLPKLFHRKVLMILQCASCVLPCWVCTAETRLLPVCWSCSNNCPFGKNKNCLLCNLLGSVYCNPFPIETTAKMQSFAVHTKSAQHCWSLLWLLFQSLCWTPQVLAGLWLPVFICFGVLYDNILSVLKQQHQKYQASLHQVNTALLIFVVADVPVIDSPRWSP